MREVLERLNKIKTQKGKEQFINETYKDILAYPIHSFRLRKWEDGGLGTGHGKGIKYDRQYNATLKKLEGHNLHESVMEIGLVRFIEAMEKAKLRR